LLFLPFSDACKLVESQPHLAHAHQHTLLPSPLTLTRIHTHPRAHTPHRCPPLSRHLRPAVSARLCGRGREVPHWGIPNLSQQRPQRELQHPLGRRRMHAQQPVSVSVRTSSCAPARRRCVTLCYHLTQRGITGRPSHHDSQQN